MRARDSLLGPLKIRVIAPAGVLSPDSSWPTQKPLGTSSHPPINTCYMPSITIDGSTTIATSHHPRQKNVSSISFIGIHHQKHNLAKMSLLILIHVSVLFRKSKKVRASK